MHKNHPCNSTILMYSMCVCVHVGSEAPAEASSSHLTSYAVRLSPANTHSSSQLSPRNSGPSQQWSGGFDGPYNARSQTNDFGLSSSPAQGASRAWQPLRLRSHPSALLRLCPERILASRCTLLAGVA